MLNKKRIYTIMVVVAVLLIGLIAVQLYWVRNAYRLKEVEFNNKVNTILEKTAAYIDKHSSHFYLYGRSYIQPGEGVFVLNTNKDTIRLFNAFPYETRPDTCFYTTGISYYDDLALVDVAMRFEYRGFDSSLNISQENRQLNELDSSNYRKRLEDPRSANERLKPGKVDSVLRALIAASGIDTGFAYGIRKKNNAAFDIINRPELSSMLATSPYKIELFTDRAFTTPHELILFIQNKDGIIRNALLGTLAASATIILLLVAAFLYFFRTVLAQKKVSEMKTDFINNMTHEFMTPVTNIGLALETLEINKQQRNETDKERILEVIGTENAHLRDNINKVLQVAVLEKGSFLLDPAPINLHELLHRVARSFDIPVKMKHGAFRFELHATNTIIIADETHIINLLYNIIDNAVKYSNGKDLDIIIRSGNANKKLWISIEDNGKGMSPEVQKNMFDKFYRGAKGNVHDVKGFGLGLTYVKSVAEAHNITIDVHSTAGKGTKFTLWFNQ